MSKPNEHELVTELKSVLDEANRALHESVYGVDDAPDEREAETGVRSCPHSPIVQRFLEAIREAEEKTLARRAQLAKRTWLERVRDAWRAARAAWRGQ